MMKKQLPKKLLLAHLGLLAATIIWAGAGPVIKLTLDFLPPFAFIVFRFAIVCTIFLPYVFFTLRSHPIDWKDLPNIFWLGVFGQASIVFIFIGLKYTTAIDAAIMNLLSPIAIILAGHYFYNEKINNVQKTGYAIATLGTLLIAIEPALTPSNTTVPTHLRIFGNFMVVIYQLAWPAYIILGKRMMGEQSSIVNKAFKYFHLHQMHKKYNSTLLTILTFYVGLAVLTPFALWESFALVNPQPIVLTFPSILGLLYMALISSIVAYLLFDWSLPKVEAADTALYNYMSPLFSIPIAMVFLGEVLTSTVTIGMAVIGLGVLIAEKYKS
uniref:EamA domain-containing protein n=1 Tax=candidate division WWE3 bacterium TaxID=2053526 RepID=A0A7C4XTX9_UNCKA